MRPTFLRRLTVWLLTGILAVCTASVVLPSFADVYCGRSSSRDIFGPSVRSLGS